MNESRLLNQADCSDEAPRWILICGEPGRYTLADAEDGESVSFRCTDGSETIIVSEMNAIELIKEPGSEEIMGYKYQLYEGGEWGFISKGFLQFVYPVFADIIPINSNEGICLAAYADARNEQIDISFSREFHGVNMHSEHQLLDIEYMYGEEQNINVLRNVSKKNFLPTAEAKVERDTVDCGRVTFYKPSEDATMALVNHANGEGFEEILFELENRILCGRRTMGSYIRIPSLELSFQSCCRALQTKELGYNVEKNIANTFMYIVEKEGYYAIVDINMKTLKIRRYETPFAFTGIEKSGCRDCYYIEQFGKKGVYKMYSGESSPYLIPCEYESIELNYAEDFVVKSKGMVGVISAVNGRWVEPLHLEN